MAHITELNIENKILEIQKLIYLWNARNLTPYGKITIIKSLLISKITHVLLSLPSPNRTTFDKLEDMFKSFLWGKKPPKFRKSILENLNNLGGMKMTDLKTFDYSLKISWIKRLISQNEGWAEFPLEMGILKTIQYGDQYLHKLKQQLRNKFWIDMLNGLQILSSKFKIKNAVQVHCMPLWYNSRLEFQYRRDWEKKGYKVLGDILDEEGTLLSSIELVNRGMKINFLDYFNLKKKITDLQITQQTVEHGPYIPRILFEIGMGEKGCSKIYNKLMSYNGNLLKEIQEKWECTLNDHLTYEIVEHAFKKLTKMKTGPYQKYFQFKFLHNRTITREKLFRMEISDSNICKNCEQEIDTLQHAFLDCNATKELWSQVEQWLKLVFSPHIKLTDIDKIFGYQMENEFIDKVILNTKLIIYNNNKDGKPHHIKAMKSLLYNQFCIEQYEAKMTQTEEKFNRIWERGGLELQELFLT